MKKPVLSLLLLCFCAGALSAGFSLGRPGAVKKRVSKLDDKVRAEQLRTAATTSSNHAPVISAVTALSTTVAAGGLATISISASDADGDTLSYVWTSTAGTIGGSGTSINWLAPSTPGVYAVTCVVSDGKDPSPGSIPVGAVSPGTIKWKFSPSASVDVPPAVGADGTVYAVASDGKLYAVNRDGSQKWSVPFTTENNDLFATAFGPVVGSDGTIYVVAADTKTYAVYPDGTLKWGPSSPVTNNVYFAPVIAADGTVYLYDDSSVVSVLSPVDGAGVSTFTALTGIYGPPVIGADGTIYLAAGSDMLYAVPPLDGLARSTATSVPAIAWPPAVGGDGTVYWLDTTDGANTALRALDSAGNPKWGGTAYVPTGAIGLPPLIGPDDAVYILSDITLYRLTATTDPVVPFTALADVASQFRPGPGGAVYAVDSANSDLYGLNSDGTTMWGPVSPAGSTGIMTAPVVGADGIVYSNTVNGEVFAVYSTAVLP